ncbi:MAG: hypothetical protein EBZ62_00350 [Sphingobacteriia bacterium]|nr:hypothetical protein [Sphingobacteriia bacterium]
MSDHDRKDIRRKNLADKNHSKPSISEEQRFLSRSKKQLKKKIEDIKAEELWEDWEDEIR